MQSTPLQDLRKPLPPVSDVVAIRAYTLACCEAAAIARAELDVLVDQLVVDREAAERALERCRATCELAERMATFAARVMGGDVDPETLADAAEAIRSLIGGER